jgi:hypothetical protein
MDYVNKIKKAFISDIYIANEGANFFMLLIYLLTLPKLPSPVFTGPFGFTGT